MRERTAKDSYKIKVGGGGELHEAGGELPLQHVPITCPDLKGEVSLEFGVISKTPKVFCIIIRERLEFYINF